MIIASRRHREGAYAGHYALKHWRTRSQSNSVSTIDCVVEEGWRMQRASRRLMRELGIAI